VVERFGSFINLFRLCRDTAAYQ